MSELARFPSHPAPASRLQAPPATCAVCEDTGWERVTIPGEPKPRVRRCECWLETHVMTPDGVPLEFKSARFDTFRETSANRPALASARVWLKGERDLFLFGPVGTGKTRLACTLLNEHGRGLFLRVAMLLLRLQQQFVEDASHESAGLFDQAAETSLLALDDLGVEKGSDYSRRTILTLYEARHDAGRRTIWTSNQDLDGTSKAYNDDRLSSRIAGWATVLKLAGDDWRLKRRGDD